MIESNIMSRLFVKQSPMGSQTRRRGSTRRVLEFLEERRLMTVTFKESPGLNPGTTSLLIIDTIKNDSLSINDNGSGAAGNIFVSSGGGQDYMSTGAVTNIGIEMGKGTDHVTYELDSNLQPSVDQFIEVGSNPKQGGSLILTANIVGKVLDQSDLTILGSPKGSKNTTMTVNDSGEIDGDFTAGIATFGSTSKAHRPEVFIFSSTAMIGPGGDIDAGLVGSTLNDVGNVSYSGTNNGKLDIFEQGNGGNDQLSADVYMIPGSTGTVGSSTDPSVLKTSGKKDRLQFTIHQGTNSTATSNIFAELIDSSKKDTSMHTDNVTALTKGTDTLVS